MNNDMKKVFYAAKHMQYKGYEKYKTIAFILSKIDAWGNDFPSEIEKLSNLFHEYPCVLKCGRLDPLRELFPKNKVPSGTACIMMYFEIGSAEYKPGTNSVFSMADMDEIITSTYQATDCKVRVETFLTLSHKVKKNRIYWIALAEKGDEI